MEEDNHQAPTNTTRQPLPKRHFTPHSRARVIAPGNEEASSTLKLGEFANDPTLSYSEARLLLNKVLQVRSQEKDGHKPEGEVLSKTMEYLDVFARFKMQEIVENVEVYLKSHQSKGEVEEFERAQLGL
jgi:DNA-directed RNA polymerase II subunit RPB4